MNRKIAIGALALTVLVALACNPLSGVLGGSQAGTATNLWPDVPAYSGADKTDLELPLFVRLAVEAASRAIMAGAGDSAGDLEFISYSSDDSAEEIMGFYTPERMAGDDWKIGENSELGCTSGSTAGEDVGGMCAFGKESGDEVSALFIVIVPGSEGRTTDLFYVRIDANPDAIATAAAQ
jgi:hypothetical protein